VILSLLPERGSGGVLDVGAAHGYSEGGKIWDRIKNVAEATNTVPHMLNLLAAARQVGLRVFYAVQRRYRPGDYESWKYIAPVQKAAMQRKPKLPS
jgi:hypothetical protein